MTVITRPALSVVALAGNPNSGKSTLFNALTGLRQKVGNYPGVTVEKKEGRLALAGRDVTLLDLPGSYSLTPRSPDEAIARDVLLGIHPDTPRPDLVLAVVDAGNLERNLYLVSEIADLGVPLVVVLTMGDLAERAGERVDTGILSRELCLPVISVTAGQPQGLAALRRVLEEATTLKPAVRQWRLPAAAEAALAEIATTARQAGGEDRQSEALAVQLLTADASEPRPEPVPPTTLSVARDARARLVDAGLDLHSAVIEARYAWLGQVCRRAVTRSGMTPVTWTARLDRVLTHRFWGLVFFIALMAIVFQAIMSWATGPMDAIDGLVGSMAEFVRTRMPAGDLRELIVDGVIAGVGGVLVFLPQIVFLFLFIGLMEDTGYMARAAFMTDRIMSRVGLHGKSFIPLLSSFACAIPGIMAARTIENRKDRLVTILIAPLMSCSARLPVYALMIGAFIPARRVWGIFTLPALTLLALYLLGFLIALAMGAVFKKTLLRGETPTFLMELPPYRKPSLRTVLFFVWSQARTFLVRAGTVILAISICIWFLTAYPKLPEASPTEQLRHSFAGRIGHAVEPVIRPLGFDWKIGIGLLSAMAAREVFVATMGTVYSVAEEDEHAGERSLRRQMLADVDPRTGFRVWSPLVAISLLVYFVLAMQCMSTIAVVRRETATWTWPLFQLGYMTGLAYVASYLVYQVGRSMGWGI